MSKNYRINSKNRKISDAKSNIPDVWNWNCWIWFGLEIEVREPWALCPWMIAMKLGKRTPIWDMDKVKLVKDSLSKFQVIFNFFKGCISFFTRPILQYYVSFIYLFLLFQESDVKPFEHIENHLILMSKIQKFRVLGISFFSLLLTRIPWKWFTFNLHLAWRVQSILHI